MAVKHVDLDDTYIPRTTNEDIVVDVKIGDGQEGSYAIFLGAEFLAANSPATLGKRADVLGKTTTISVTIVDELQETNWTSITVIVSEGMEITKFGPYAARAEHHLDTVIYTLKLIH